MARTNIDLDEDACRAVMKRYGCATKRDAVNLALRQAAAVLPLDEALAMRGTGWDLDLDDLRDDPVAEFHTPLQLAAVSS